MLEELGSAFVELSTWTHAGYMLAGVLVGIVVGILPGLGGTAGMALLLPFVFGMEPTSALAMMIGLLAVLATADTFTSVLMGVPGSAGSQATVVDGFPLARAGQASRALSAAFAASLFGGVFGALVLTGFVQIARPLVLAFGAPELFMLTLFGLSMVGVLSGKNWARGLAACGLGLLIGMAGPAPATGHMRLTFGDDYLSDGIPLVVLALGLFALPEIIDLMGQRGAIAQSSAPLGTGWAQGLRDTIKNRWLVLRSATIGCIVGAIPGLGGAVVDWIAYGAAVQMCPDKENFGKGDIRGVIAPESANNAKEGGALIPTLIFGIPGSGGTAVLLGGMLLIGIQPGPRMIVDDAQTVYLIIWTLAIANLVGAAICVGITPLMSRVANLRYALIAPFMISVVMFGAYQATRNWGDLITVCAIGVASLVLKRFGWPRPPLLIGFVLAEGSEVYLYQSVQIHGMDWMTRPIVIVLFLMTLVSIWLGSRTRIESESADAAEVPSGMPQVVVTGLVALAGLIAIVDAWDLPRISTIFPIAVGAATIVFAAISLFVARPQFGSARSVLNALPRDLRAGAWIVGFLCVTALIGFLPAIVLVFASYLIIEARLHAAASVGLAVAAAAIIHSLGWLLTIRFPVGLLDLGI